MAKHIYGIDSDYHHNLAFINRISFLPNYLSDIVDGADSYSDWMNADLHEHTTEKFGVCPVPGDNASTKLKPQNRFVFVSKWSL